MKTIGLIGGLSWPSTVQYYEAINRKVQTALGDSHSAKILLYSFDFHEIELLQHRGLWPEAGTRLISAAKVLEQGGADFLLICSNTMHRLADDVQRAVQIPLLHIAEVTASRVKQSGVHMVGLLGTAFTMEESFYKDRLIHHGLRVLIPGASDRAMLQEIIYSELVRGVVKGDSQKSVEQIIARLLCKGAEGIILGCTEIMLLTGSLDMELPLFDSTTLHAHAAAEWAVRGDLTAIPTGR